MCVALACPEFLDAEWDPDQFDQIQTQLAREFKEKDRDEWFELLRQHGIPIAPVPTIGEALSNDHFRARGCPGGDDAYDRIRSPLRLQNSGPTVSRRSSRLDEHTDEILREGGFSLASIARLRESGAVV